MLLILRLEDSSRMNKTPRDCTTHVVRLEPLTRPPQQSDTPSDSDTSCSTMPPDSSTSDSDHSPITRGNSALSKPVIEIVSELPYI